MTNTLDNETALAKIKVLIGAYYEGVGRKDYHNYLEEIEKELIENIDDVLGNTEIDIKKVVVERLGLDKMNHQR